jgi:hypothetical protein
MSLRLARQRHPRRGGLPHELNLLFGEAVRGVRQIADLLLQPESLARKRLGGNDRALVFVAQAVQRRQVRWILLAA